MSDQFQLHSGSLLGGLRAIATPPIADPGFRQMDAELARLLPG